MDTPLMCYSCMVPIPIEGPSFSCTGCGYIHSATILNRYVSRYLESLPDIPDQPRIMVYFSRLLEYKGTPVGLIVLYYVYKTALDNPNVIFYSNSLRDCLLNGVPLIQANYQYTTVYYDSVMEITSKFVETFSDNNNY